MRVFAQRAKLAAVGSARPDLGYEDVEAAAERVAGRVRPVAVVPGGRPGLWFALEHLQHTGSFKARGAQNFIAAHQEAGALPQAGVTIASGGNAGLACAWAARQLGVRATVFVPEAAPAVKVAGLRRLGADVRLAGAEYAEALAACEAFAAESGALASHAYDHPLIAAGAGTLLEEIAPQVPGMDTVVVAVGGGGLFAGVATAAHHGGIRAVAVEPEECCALHAAVEAGEPVDVPVRSVAADSLGARRATPLALRAAQDGDSRSVLVSDDAIVHARRELWQDFRLVVEHGAAAAYAAVRPEPNSEGSDPSLFGQERTLPYQAAEGETVVVVLCGANTDPSDLAAKGSDPF